MHKSRQIALLDPANVHGYGCIYEPKEHGTDAPEVVVFKSLRDDFDTDDFVIVETDTRHNMTVVQVKEIGAEIDLESEKPLRWIVSGPLDLTEYRSVLSQERHIQGRIKKSQARKRAEELRAAVLGDMTEEEVAALQIEHKPE